MEEKLKVIASHHKSLIIVSALLLGLAVIPKKSQELSNTIEMLTELDLFFEDEGLTRFSENRINEFADSLKRKDSFEILFDSVLENTDGPHLEHISNYPEDYGLSYVVKPETPYRYFGMELHEFLKELEKGLDQPSFFIILDKDKVVSLILKDLYEQKDREELAGSYNYQIKGSNENSMDETKTPYEIASSGSDYFIALSNFDKPYALTDKSRRIDSAQYSIRNLTIRNAILASTNTLYLSKFLKEQTFSDLYAYDYWRDIQTLTIKEAILQLRNIKRTQDSKNRIQLFGVNLEGELINYAAIAVYGYLLILLFIHLKSIPTNENISYKNHHALLLYQSKLSIIFNWITVSIMPITSIWAINIIHFHNYILALSSSCIFLLLSVLLLLQTKRLKRPTTTPINNVLSDTSHSQPARRNHSNE